MASTDLDLCYLTATEAIDQFKAKKLSPVELMKALLARCEAVNPKLNVLLTRSLNARLSRRRPPRLVT